MNRYRVSDAARSDLDEIWCYIAQDNADTADKFIRALHFRPAFRWRQLVALARVTASEYGRPAAGISEAKELLKT